MSSPQPQTSPHALGERYEVLSQLGSGASADVFRVRDLRSGAVRAAKVLKPGHAANAEVLARFEDEFRILRTLHHPHLPEVFDYGVNEDGQRILVMELVEGEPLDQYFRAHPEDIWVILYEICETLVFVHARNLLHQDIKPSNILVSRAVSAEGARPVIKLIDFGLTYRRGVDAAVKLVGTAEYVAPEVVRGERALTRAVDYYSLGATLYELLYGRPPFNGSESEILRAHLEREPHFEDEELEWAELYPHVRALLAKDAQKRLAAFEEFRRIVVGRLTGGIDELDRSYALARVDSLGMIGKRDAWGALTRWLDVSVAGANSAEAHTFSISGSEGAGKRFLVSALRAEASVRGVRTLSPAEIGRAERDDVAARQPAMMWSRLLEVCEREPVVLVVERPMSLPDEERSFVRLAGTQWELYRSRGRVLPLFFLVAADSTTEDADTLDYLPADGAVKIELPALQEAQRSQIVEQFRGNMFDPRDARALATYLERFDDCGSAIQGLQRAVLRGGLTFFGQRWKVQPGLLTEIIETSREDSFSRDLVASLSPLEQSVAAAVAAHPDPVPVAWVAEFVGVETVTLPSIMAGTLRRLLSVSAESVAPVSKIIRSALRAGCDPAETRRAQRFLAQRTAALERTPSTDRALAHHYQQLGLVRDAARVHLRLLHAYWSIRPRERPYELIEGVCRSGLELLESNGASISTSSRRHLFCFYIKEWIKSFWARNLFTHAKPVIDEWTQRLGETMPASVAPRYVRSVLEREGAEAALSHLGIADKLVNKMSRQLLLRLALERSLSMHALNDFDGAMRLLVGLDDDSTLSKKDRYRAIIYSAMNIEDLRGFGASFELLSESLVDHAVEDSFIDEALLIIAIRTRASVAKGRTEHTIREIARGLGIARRAGLNLRSHLFYRLAGTVYADSNQLRKAQACLRRAIQLAGSMGMRYLVATGWARLAEREFELGRLGNARRYSDRAIEMLATDAQVTDRNQALITSFAVDVLSRRNAKTTSLSSLLTSPVAANERGQFYLWQGRELLFRGLAEDSLKSFSLARQSFEESGVQVNVTWAALQAARASLLLLDRQGFEQSIASIRFHLQGDAPGLSQFDFRIVELLGAYVFRHDSNATLVLARDAEALAAHDANILMRIELLQVIFRVFARNGQVADALRVFEKYRALTTEVVANVGTENGNAIAELLGVSSMVEDYRKLSRERR